MVVFVEVVVVCHEGGGYAAMVVSVGVIVVLVDVVMGMMVLIVLYGGGRRTTCTLINIGLALNCISTNAWPKTTRSKSRTGSVFCFQMKNEHTQTNICSISDLPILHV